jgi:hypothetical protein
MMTRSVRGSVTTLRSQSIETPFPQPAVILAGSPANKEARRGFRRTAGLAVAKS